MPSTEFPSTKKIDSPQGEQAAQGRHLVPGLSLAARPGLFLLLTVLLAGLCFALACWGGAKPAHSPAEPVPSSEKNLLAEPSSLKFNNTSAPSTDSTPAPVFEVDLTQLGPEVSVSPAPVAASPMANPGVPATYKEPEPPRRVEVKPAMPIPEEVLDDGELFRNSLRGDTPMLRTWKMLGLSTFLAGALAAAPSPAAQFDGVVDPEKSTAEQLRKLTESIKELQSKIDTLTKEDIAQIKTRLANLEREVESLKKAPITSSSGYIPSNGAKGRVRLVNTYFEEMTIVVNKIAYRVAPGGEQMIDAVPAGAFSYWVLNAQPEAQNRSLAAGETFTITVHPR